jgi:hypothetical protein
VQMNCSTSHESEESIKGLKELIKLLGRSGGKG